MDRRGHGLRGRRRKQGARALLAHACPPRSVFRTQVWYRVVVWPAAWRVRASVGLPAKDFHITLGFTRTDIHDSPKGPATLVFAAGGDRVAVDASRKLRSDVAARRLQAGAAAPSEVEADMATLRAVVELAQRARALYAGTALRGVSGGSVLSVWDEEETLALEELAGLAGKLHRFDECYDISCDLVRWPARARAAAGALACLRYPLTTGACCGSAAAACRG